MPRPGDPALQRFLRAKDGIDRASVAGLQRALGATDGDMAGIAGVSRTTFRAHAQSGKFGENESEHLIRVEAAITAACDAMGSAAEVRAWLDRPNRGLGNLVPRQMLGSPSGVDAVHNALLRMCHGVHA